MQAQQGQSIKILEDWKMGIEIAKKAVDEYKQAEVSQKITKSKSEILKQIGIILGIIAAILYAYAATRGIRQ